MTFQPAAPEPGDLSIFFLNIRKIHPKTKLFPKITYPITPKTKPIIPVYAKVSDVPPPLVMGIRIRNPNPESAQFSANFGIRIRIRNPFFIADSGF